VENMGLLEQLSAAIAVNDRAVLALLGAKGFPDHRLIQRRIRENVVVDPVSGCWVWHGTTDPDGYGMLGGRRAYRLSYEAFNGAIPLGYHVDHVCRNRRCVNPEQTPKMHLEPVTRAENNRRAMLYVQQYPGEQVHHAAKRWCIKGHPYSADNTYVDKRGRRACLECRREYDRASKRRRNIPMRSYREFRVDEAMWAIARPTLGPYVAQELISTAQAAEQLGTTVSCLQKWRARHSGLLEEFRVKGRGKALRFRADEVDLLAGCKTTLPWTKRPRVKAEAP
jgi:hypothetical protein